MQFDRGYISLYFLNNAEKMRAELEDAYILTYEKKLSSLEPMLPLLEATASNGSDDQAGFKHFTKDDDERGEHLDGVQSYCTVNVPRAFSLKSS